MSDKNEPMDHMMKLWKTGQDTFFNAQKNMAENFNHAFTSKPTVSFDQSLEAWKNFIKAWAPSWDPASAMNTPNSKESPHQYDAFFAVFDQNIWMSQAPEQLRSILQNITQFPKFADVSFAHVEGAEQWEELLELQKATRNFAKIMHGAWQRAYTRYSEKFSLDDLKSGNVQKALDTWIKTANEELLDTQSSDGFMTAQRSLIRAINGLKQRQAKMAEAWSNTYQMPTRSEIDDLTKTVTELKREMRNLKRSLAKKT